MRRPRQPVPNFGKQSSMRMWLGTSGTGANCSRLAGEWQPSGNALSEKAVKPRWYRISTAGSGEAPRSSTPIRLSDESGIFEVFDSVEALKFVRYFYLMTRRQVKIRTKRRGGDSNPRHGYPCNCLAGSPVRPLQHLSPGPDQADDQVRRQFKRLSIIGKPYRKHH